MIHYSNPRMNATFDDWPSGRHRTTAHFSVETHPTRGQRGVRITLHPLTQRPAAPKKLTYARHVRIVDGDDGRTYFLEQGIYSGTLHVMQATMQYLQESIDASDPRYAATLALFQD